MNIVTKIYREEGFSAYYRGLVPTLIGIMPYAGISFFTYESLKKLYHDVFHDSKKLNPLHRLLFGACAGLFGQSATYPLDIIRRRMQTDGIYGASRPEYRRMWSTAKYVYATEGLKKGLYKGLSMNWVKGPIAVGVSFTTFDLLHGFLQRRFIQTDTGWANSMESSCNSANNEEISRFIGKEYVTGTDRRNTFDSFWNRQHIHVTTRLKIFNAVNVIETECELRGDEMEISWNPAYDYKVQVLWEATTWKTYENNNLTYNEKQNTRFARSVVRLNASNYNLNPLLLLQTGQKTVSGRRNN